ncbi:MAG: hypothetical protein ABL977_04735 [Candidatus Eisenbacteria bacterium]
MNRWCFALAVELLLAANVARAGSITSFEPDTTSALARRPKGTPPDMVDVPVWLGVQTAVASPHTSDAYELPAVSVAPLWLGASATYPWRTRGLGWVEMNYERVRFFRRGTAFVDSSNFTRFLPGNSAQFDQFTVRWGLERCVGSQAKPWATIGAGLGYATGFGNVNGFDGNMLTGQVLGRVALFVYPFQITRIGLNLTGGPSYSHIEHYGGTAWNHAEVTLRVESMLRLPRRLIPPAPNAAP